MACGGCGISSLLKDKHKDKKTVNNYYIKDDHSVEIRDSVVNRTNVGARMKICPYCGKRLEMIESPNFCPYCERRLQ